jgi:hypothetical protein
MSLSSHPLLVASAALSLAVGCGSALFGGGGVDHLNPEDKPYFEGCSFEESKGASVWDCSDATTKIAVEYRACPSCGRAPEDAVKAFLADHAALGAVTARREGSVSFPNNGGMLKVPVAALQHPEKLAFVAAGPAAGSTAPSRTPYYVACVFDQKAEVKEQGDVVGLAVVSATCQRRLRAVLGVVERHHP